ncbi:MAG: hypothetical protein ACREL3_03605 [Gemmatimonadales bacterium]
MLSIGLRIKIGIVIGAVTCASIPERIYAQASGGNVIVYLDPMTTAGVGGTVNLAPSGEETNLEVTLKPGESPSDAKEYRVQVAQGSCSTPGRVVEGFGDVRADGKTRQQEGSLRLADVRKGDHVIQVAGKGKNEVVACGMIPADTR